MKKEILLLGAGGNAAYNFVQSVNMDLHLRKEITITGVDHSDYGRVRATEYCDIVPTRPFCWQDERWDYVHAQPDSEVQNAIIGGNNIHNLWFSNLFSDKWLCQKTWASSRDDIEVIRADTFLNTQHHNYPYWLRAIRGAGSKAALPIKSFRGAHNLICDWMDYWQEKEGLNYWDFMLTTFLEGPEYAVQLFYIDGELYHAGARERVEYMFGDQMASGQSSSPSVARTIADSDVINHAILAVRTLQEKPHGIYCVDLKSHNGIPFPTEVNYGRFFTTSNFFATLGMNTPAEYLRYALWEQYPVKRINTIEPNVYWLRGVDREPLMIEGEDFERYYSGDASGEYEVRSA